MYLSQRQTEHIVIRFFLGIVLISILIVVCFFGNGCFIGPNKPCNEQLLCASTHTCHNGFCITNKTLEAISDAGDKE